MQLQTHIQTYKAVKEEILNEILEEEELKTLKRFKSRSEAVVGGIGLTRSEPITLEHFKEFIIFGSDLRKILAKVDFVKNNIEDAINKMSADIYLKNKDEKTTVVREIVKTEMTEMNKLLNGVKWLYKYIESDIEKDKNIVFLIMRALKETIQDLTFNQNII